MIQRIALEHYFAQLKFVLSYSANLQLMSTLCNSIIWLCIVPLGAAFAVCNHVDCFRRCEVMQTKEPNQRANDCAVM